jgi:hypothetical protein
MSYLFTQSPRATLRRLWAFNWPLTLSALLYIALIPVYIVAAILDPRIITGMPAFVKPLKFILSSAIYLTTFLWLLTLVQGRRRWVSIVAWVTSVGFLVENVIITAQAIRGTMSHYNLATPLDATLFSLMGGFVTLIALMNLILGAWLLFQRLPDRTLAWGIRLGLLIAAVGIWSAFLMTTLPSPAQQAQMAAGQAPTAFGAHSVGVEDGGPGLPFLGWSTEGGDLRVAHFVGMHAMQALPLLGFLLTRPAARRRWHERQRTALLLIGGVTYLGWTLLLIWQALRGQSVIAPDAQTWLAYALLIGLSGAAALLALRRRPAPFPV